ncbi:hypothetical protein Q1695_015096 [Nippostrongylus brasiliensis]|nr:hypothetical protein Q1695_015096 [Nippostrongylus brasiliensis]
MMLLLLIILVMITMLTSMVLNMCNKDSGRREQAKPRPLPPPPPHIELAGSGTKEDHTLRDVASLTKDDDSSKKVKKSKARPRNSREFVL